MEPQTDAGREEHGTSHLPPGIDEGKDGGGEVATSSEISARARRVSRLITDLAKTARSFLLYDPRNAAIHSFLEELVNNFVATLKSEGAIRLNFQAFEIWFEGEVVYLNRDRERSLAFRLYRDGVRALTFSPGFGWEELARILEVLSIRFTGVHQHEDDCVTMLWKANFSHVEIVAVEGFVPDEEEAPVDLDRLRNPGAKADDEAHLPDDLDLPRPHLTKMAKVEWVDVSDQRLEALRDEVSAAALPEDCLHLTERLWVQMGSASDPMKFEEVAHLFQEILSFLISEEHLPSLRRWLEAVDGFLRSDPPAWDAGRNQAFKAILTAAGDSKTVYRLIHSVPVEGRELTPDWFVVIDRLIPDPLGAVLEALPQEHSASGRAAGRALLEHYIRGQTDRVMSLFKVASGTLAADLLLVIAGSGGEGGVNFIASQVSHADSAVREEALRLLLDMPYSGSVGRALMEAWKQSEGKKRTLLLERIVLTGDKRFVDQLARFIEEHASDTPLPEAEAIGRAMGQLGGVKSLSRWEEWLKPEGFFRKSLPGLPARQVAAASAAAAVPGEDAEALLIRTHRFAAEPLKDTMARMVNRHKQLNKKGAS